MEGKRSTGGKGSCGRKSFLTKLNLTETEAIEIYLNCAHIEEFAARLEIGERTARNFLKARGVPVRHRPPGKTHRRSGTMAQWLREHPNERLPRDIVEAAHLTGLSYRTVHGYVYREKKREIERVVETIRMIRETNDYLVLGGNRLPVAALKRVKVTGELLSNRFDVYVWFKNKMQRKYFLREDQIKGGNFENRT